MDRSGVFTWMVPRVWSQNSVTSLSDGVEIAAR